MEGTDFKNIFRAISLPGMVVKSEGAQFTIVEANDKYLEVMGTTREYLLGRAAQEAFPGNPNTEGMQVFVESLQRVLSTLKTDKVEGLRFDVPIPGTQEFTEKYWSPENIPILNEQGEVEYILHLTQEVTAEVLLKKKEQQLKQKLDKKTRDLDSIMKLQEKRFKALVQEGSDILAVIDMEGNFTFVSETTTSIMGLSPEEMMGQSSFGFIHPEDLPKLREQFHALVENKKVQFESYRFVDGKGNWRWLETNVTKLLQDPAVQGVVFNSRDITEYYKQAREIERISERFRLVANASHDLVYDWDLKTDEIMKFHRNHSELLGHSFVEVEKNNFWEQHVHPEDLEGFRHQQKKIFQDVKEEIFRSEYRFRRADNSYAYLMDRAHIVRNSEGRAVRMVGSIRDISDIKANEEALKIANERFKLAMEATNEMIWDWDVAADVVQRSIAFSEIYGYEEETAPSMVNYWFPKISVKDRARVETSFFAALNDPHCDKWSAGYRFIKANGKIAHVLDRGHILRDKTGKAIRMVGAVLDMTEREITMKRIKTQNKLLTQIAWEQSHVVRAPVARMQALMQFMEEGNFEEFSRQEILQHLSASTNELDEIVKEIVRKTQGYEFENDLTQSR